MTPDTRQAERPDEQGWALTRLIGLHNGILTGYLDEVDKTLGALPGGRGGQDRGGRRGRTTRRAPGGAPGLRGGSLASALNMLSRVVSEDDFPAPPPPERFDVSTRRRDG